MKWAPVPPWTTDDRLEKELGARLGIEVMAYTATVDRAALYKVGISVDGRWNWFSDVFRAKHERPDVVDDECMVDTIAIRLMKYLNDYRQGGWQVGNPA